MQDHGRIDAAPQRFSVQNHREMFEPILGHPAHVPQPGNPEQLPEDFSRVAGCQRFAAPQIGQNEFEQGIETFPG